MAEPFIVSGTFRNPDGQEFIFEGAITVKAAVIPAPAPLVTSITPAEVAYEGGTPMTWGGSDFKPGATLLVGDRPCTDVVVNEAGTIATCLSPSFA